MEDTVLCVIYSTLPLKAFEMLATAIFKKVSMHISIRCVWRHVCTCVHVTAVRLYDYMFYVSIFLCSGKWGCTCTFGGTHSTGGWVGGRLRKQHCCS